MLFAIAGCVSSCQRPLLSLSGRWRNRTAGSSQVLETSAFRLGLVYSQIAPLFLLFPSFVGRAESNRRSSKASGTTAERRCARLLTIPLIPIWLLLLPAFCPRFRAPHGGRTKNKRYDRKKMLTSVSSSPRQSFAEWHAMDSPTASLASCRRHL